MPANFVFLRLVNLVGFARSVERRVSRERITRNGRRSFSHFPVSPAARFEFQNAYVRTPPTSRRARLSDVRTGSSQFASAKRRGKLITERVSRLAIRRRIGARKRRRDRPGTIQRVTRRYRTRCRRRGDERKRRRATPSRSNETSSGRERALRSRGKKGTRVTNRGRLRSKIKRHDRARGSTPPAPTRNAITEVGTLLRATREIISPCRCYRLGRSTAAKSAALPIGGIRREEKNGSPRRYIRFRVVVRRPV